jgi:hypothetical protein
MKQEVAEKVLNSRIYTILWRVFALVSIIISLFVLVTICDKNTAFAADSEKINAGFVSGIWYSKFPFFADENIRIYVAFQNQSDSDITGKMEFYDNGKRFETKEFSALSNRLVEGWADFAAEKGKHQIHVKLIDVKKNTSSGWNSNVSIEPNIIEAGEIFVDYDTDGDGIGNDEDEDDDGDGYSDKEEDDADTDPLDKKDYPKKSGGGNRDDDDDSDVLGVQFVNTIKNTAGGTIENINTGADSLNDKIKNKISSLESELSDLKNKSDALKQTIVEGKAEINAPAETKSLSKKIALKTGELYLFKTLFGILEYKILLYLLILLVVWFVIKGIWNFFRK